MNRRNNEGDVTLTTLEARSGETSGHVRVVLIVGMTLAVTGLGAMLLLWAQ